MPLLLFEEPPCPIHALHVARDMCTLCAHLLCPLCRFVVEGSLQLNHMKDELELPTADEAAGYISIVNRFAE